MTVYKYFIKIALKNKAIILGYTAIFFILSIINGTSVQKETAFTDTKLNIGVVDNSSSELSNALVDYLGRKNNIVEVDEDLRFIKEQIFLEVLDGVLIIPEDLDEKTINKEKSIEVYKDDRQIASYQIQNQVNKFLAFANGTYEDGSFDLVQVGFALDEGVKVKFMDSNNNKNANADSWFKYYFNFTSYIIMALYISLIGFVMIEITGEGIERRRRVSSIKFLQFNKEIYLGQLTIASFITAVFILGAIVLKGKYIGEVDFLKYVINMIVFSTAILCLTFLINNLTNDKFVINGLGTVLSLGTSFISGVLIPQEFLGEKVLAIAKFFPTYYFVQINEKTMNSFGDIQYEIFIQLLFGLAFFLIGLYFSKAKENI